MDASMSSFGSFSPSITAASWRAEIEN
jgi:hypothetical protein